ncbi:mutt nudix family protein [Entamoeba histolytica]|nr:mutt nudix family protein [Entamoeba histolytica]
MNFTSSHMQRLDSIREAIGNDQIDKLLPTLKATNKQIIFVCYNQMGNPNIRDGSAFYTEKEMIENNIKIIVYMGTTEDKQYVAVETEHAPVGSISMNLTECMKLEHTMCDIIGFGSALIKFNQRFSYCPRCGNKMKYGGFGTHMDCGSCKNMVFPRTDPCIIVVVRHPTEKKCLFVRKSIMPEKRYTCVAGFLEVGESAEECVTREVWEEVHLHVKDVKYVTSSGYPLPGANQIMLGYEAQAIDSEIDIIPGNELCEAFWVNEEEVKQAINESKKPKPEGRYTVPPTYIAHQLFQYWVNHM